MIWSVTWDETDPCGGTKALKQKKKSCRMQQRYHNQSTKSCGLHNEGSGQNRSSSSSRKTCGKKCHAWNMRGSACKYFILCTNTFIHADAQTCPATDPATVCQSSNDRCYWMCVYCLQPPPTSTPKYSKCSHCSTGDSHAHTVHRHTPQLTAYPHATQTNTYCWA